MGLLTFMLRVFFAVQRPLDIKNRPRIPIPDEDPYSVAGNGPVANNGNGPNGVVPNGGMLYFEFHQIYWSIVNHVYLLGHVAVTREHLMLQAQQLAQKRSERPPKLPPRDNYHPHDIPKVNQLLLITNGL